MFHHDPVPKERKYLKSINLSSCQGITDVDESALGDGCGELHTSYIYNCQYNTALSECL